MKQRLLLAACATVLVAACSDREDTGSDNPTAPGTVAFSHQGDGPHVCSYRDAQAYARAYFKSNADRNSARNYLQTAEGASSAADRDNALFGVLQLVAVVGGDPAKSNLPLDGAKLVGEVVDCGGSAWSMTDHRAFEKITEDALTDGFGGFAVVGGSSLYGDATATHVFAESNEAAYGLNAYHPDYVTSPPTWASALGGRAVVILGKVTEGAPNFGLTQVVTLVYRVNLIFADANRPAAFFDDDMFAAEFCAASLTDTPAAASNRVGRNRSTGNAVLQAGNLAGFCGVGDVQGPAPSPSVFATVVDRVLSVFRPTPLQAYMFVPPWSGSSGGQGTSFSDFSSDFAVVDVESVHDSVPSIPDQVINQSFSFPITVCAVAKCGKPGAVPLENAAVTTTVTGNFGTPITLSGPGCPEVQGNLSCTVYTDETGTATFNVSLNKTGSYTFSISTNFPPFTVGPTSTQFIVRAN